MYITFLLLGKIQSLKHSVPKGDKKKKKEITLEIAKLEAEQDERHNKEIEEFNKNEKKVHIINFLSYCLTLSTLHSVCC